jgi:hypothetical protein
VNFLLCYSLGSDLLCLVILLVYLTFITSIRSNHLYNDYETLIIMPVTTRAQARLSTGSSSELSTAILTGTRVLSESIPLPHLNNIPSDPSASQFLLSNKTSSHRFHLTMLIVAAACLLHSLFYFKIRNLKILELMSSMFQTFFYNRL